MSSARLSLGAQLLHSQPKLVSCGGPSASFVPKGTYGSSLALRARQPSTLRTAPLSSAFSSQLSFRATYPRQTSSLAALSGDPGMATPAPPSTATAPPKAPLNDAPSFLLDPRVALAVHVGTVAVVGFTFFNRSLFGYHPTLMALAFLLLMPQAILAAIRGTGKARKDAIKQHQLLNAASAVAAIGGLAAIWMNKERNSKPHLMTLHAILGAAAFVTSSLIATGGLPLVYGFPQALRKGGLPKAVTAAHKLIGMLAFLLASVVSVLGLQTFKPQHPLHKGMLTYATAALVMLSAAVVIVAAQAKLGKKKSK